MTVWHLVIREILYRKLNFLLVVLAVLVAIGALVGAVTLLHAHDIRTGEIIAAKAAETAARVAARQKETAARVAARREEAKAAAEALKETYRKIMLRFGYNLVILPKAETLVSYQVQGLTTKTMPEENVRTLSDSKIMTVRHLLPILKQKQVVIAGDNRREVFLVGTRGEVPLAHRTPKKPLLATVADGQVIVGHQVAEELGLKLGDSVKIVDRQFKVIRIYDERGTHDDATVWIALTTAQAMLAQKGRINAILALSCICTHAELEKIKLEIAEILPDTHVHVMVSDAVIRYEARYHANEEARRKVLQAHIHARREVQRERVKGREDIRHEQSTRATLKGDIEALAGWMVPLMLIISAVLTAMMALVNVRERRAEIGVWRAIGLRSRKIFSIFLGKGLLAGAAGAALGYPVGFFVACAWPQAPAPALLFDPTALVVVLLLAPVLTVAAAWVPAMLAARQDPAVVLREE